MNDTKLDWTLLPYDDALEEVVKVLQFGLEKHGSRDGWKQVPIDIHAQKAMRHLISWVGGKPCDESGLSHLAHAAANILFMLWREAQHD